MKCIKAEEKITSSTFYDIMVPRILEAINNMKVGEDIVIDLSKTVSVDAMAVPLLLNTARWIIGQKGINPQIYIPNLDAKKDLKNYLEKVGFFNTCDFYDYYGINTERIFAKMNQINFATYIFIDNAKDDSQEERERIEESVLRKLINSNINNSYVSFWDYWREFNDSQAGGNVVENVIRAICANTGIHTKENAILTLQRNIALNRVCISVADCGQGLYDSLKRKKGFQPTTMSFEKFKTLKGEEADLYAIVEAVAYRFYDEEYGLYHILIKLLEFQTEQEKGHRSDKDKVWKMRIHTNNKRIIFTGNNCRGLEKASTKQDFVRKLLMLCKSKYVARTTCNYPGVHVEIEIPYDKEKV
jgi:hypothetical protein